MTPQEQPTLEQPTLFLIAHKVRGEPAFDIAHRLQIGEDNGWIIPTSGHRAYPYAFWALDDLADISDYPHQYPARIYDPPDELPDHYSICTRPRIFRTPKPTPKPKVAKTLQDLINF